MNKYLKILASALLIYSSSALALNASDKPIEGSQIGVAYLRPNSNQIYGHNIDTYMHPASTLKVLTGLAAILYLGHDYRFRTNLEIESSQVNSQGGIKVDANGTLHGNVLVKFVGDPSFTAQNYRTLLNTLSTAGVKSIAGDMIIDVSRFGGLSKGAGWSWSDLPICFTAPAGSAIINRNCVFAQLQPHGVGNIATPIVSKGSPITLKSDAIGVKQTSYGGNCELEADLYMKNHYH